MSGPKRTTTVSVLINTSIISRYTVLPVSVGMGTVLWSAWRGTPADTLVPTPGFLATPKNTFLRDSISTCRIGYAYGFCFRTPNQEYLKRAPDLEIHLSIFSRLGRRVQDFDKIIDKFTRNTSCKTSCKVSCKSTYKVTRKVSHARTLATLSKPLTWRPEPLRPFTIEPLYKPNDTYAGHRVCKGGNR